MHSMRFTAFAPLITATIFIAGLVAIRKFESFSNVITKLLVGVLMVLMSLVLLAASARYAETSFKNHTSFQTIEEYSDMEYAE